MKTLAMICVALPIVILIIGATCDWKEVETDNELLSGFFEACTLILCAVVLIAIIVGFGWGIYYLFLAPPAPIVLEL